MTSQEKALLEFAQFAAKLKGDEKSEAQTFLFHLLAAFGHDANRLREAHSALDSAVRSAYGMKDGEEVLGFLLRHLELAQKESAGTPVVGPGLPAWVPTASEF